MDTQEQIDGCTLCNLQALMQVKLPHSPFLTSEWNISALHLNPSEKAGIKQHISLLEERTSNLDQAIGLLQEQLQRLTVEKWAYQNLLPRILQMPTEIHQLIFQLCINDWASQGRASTFIQPPGYDHDPSRTRYDWPNPPRRVLARVCRVWRNTVLNCPELWCDIDIKSYYVASHGGPLLEHDLAHSKDLPLRAFLSNSNLYDLPEPSYTTVNKLLRQIRHRLVSFDVGDYIHEFSGLFSEPGATPKFPILESLSGDFNHILTENDTVMNTPLISQLDLTLDVAGLKDTDIFPWSNLRRIVLRSASRVQMEIMLSQLPSITELALQLTDWHWNYNTDSGPPSNKPIILPLVHTLTIEAHEHGDWEKMPDKFISQLRLPALNKLIISRLCGFTSLIEMLRATNSSTPTQRGVQVLELENVNVYSSIITDPDSIYSVLCLLPNLKTVAIRNIEDTFYLLDSLSEVSKSGNSLVCPSLDKLSITGGKLSPQTLSHFITTRRNKKEKTFNHLTIDNSHLFPDGWELQDVGTLIRALRNFISLPHARLRVYLRLNAKIDHAQTPCKIYYSGISKGGVDVSSMLNGLQSCKMGHGRAIICTTETVPARNVPLDFA